MKCTPLLFVVFFGTALTTALDIRSGLAQDGTQPTGGSSSGTGAMGHGHHGHLHSSYTGQHLLHMSGTLAMPLDEPKPTGAIQQQQKQQPRQPEKRGAARGGGSRQSGVISEGELQVDQLTMAGALPSGAFPSRDPSGKGQPHHTGGHASGEVMTMMPPPPQQTGGAVISQRAGLHGGQGHHSGHRGAGAGGGHQSMTTSEYQTVTRVSQVHVPTTLTKMVTANGH